MNFREWNDAIAKELFNETKEGERVFLFCNSGFIDEIANKNNSSRQEFIDVLKEGEPGTTKSLSFIEKANRSLKNWEKNPDEYEYPPFIGYLAFFIMSDDDHGSEAYWANVERLLGEMKLGANRQIIDKLFQELHLWTEVLEGSLGIFKFFRLGVLRNVGLVKGQLFFNKSDLDNLPNIFSLAEFNPDFPPPEAELFKETRLKGKDYLRHQTQELLKECESNIVGIELREGVLEILQNAIKEWDGFPSDTTIESKSIVSMILSIEPKGFDKKLSYKIRTKSVFEFPEEGIEVQNEDSSQSLFISSYKNGYSKYVKHSSGDIYQPLLQSNGQEKFIFYNQETNNPISSFIFKQKPIRVFLYEHDGLNNYIEVPSAPSNKEFFFLAHKDIRDDVESLKKDFISLEEMPVQYDANLSDWTFFKTKGLKNDEKLKQLDTSFSFSSAQRASWEGGVKADASQTNYLNFARPNLNVPFGAENGIFQLVYESNNGEEKVDLNKTSDPNLLKLPAKIPSDVRMKLHVLKEAGTAHTEEEILNLMLVENPTWPPPKKKEFYINKNGESSVDEAEERISGVRIPAELIKKNYQPTLYMAIKGIKAKLIGKNPIYICEYPGEPLDPDWTPVWAVIPQGKKNYDITYLQESIEGFLPEDVNNDQLEENEMNKFKKWKTTFKTSKNRKFTDSKRGKEIEELWAEYVKKAKSL